MNLVERQTAELEGPALDWAMAQIENEPVRFDGEFIRCVPGQFSDEAVYSPATDWAQGGPLIVKYGIGLLTPAMSPCGEWHASLLHPDYDDFTHPTNPLIAVCRAIVAVHFGNTVQVPEELAQ